jgi:hypothetical protein
LEKTGAAMNAHKGNSFGLLFLFSFGIYAVFPLSCTLTSSGVTEVVTVKNEVPPVAEYGRDILRGKVRGRIVPRKGSSVTFFMEEKRAVLSENSLMELVSTGAVFSSGEDLLFFPSTLACQTDNADSDRGDRGRHRLCLCHSPPFA